MQQKIESFEKRIMAPILPWTLVPLQTTLGGSITCVGTGVHSGASVKLVLKPAPEGHGIVFYRHTQGKRLAIPALWTHVSSTNLCTTLRHIPSDTLPSRVDTAYAAPDQSVPEVSISTVEHILSALSGLGIDNAMIEVHGTEIPIMDGSAATFVQLIDEAGVAEQSAYKRILVVKKTVRIGDEHKWATLSPAEDREFTFECLFDRPTLLDNQYFSMTLTPTTYRQEVAKARTFGFIEEVEHLQSKGLARGASLDNAVGLSANGVLNPEGLRYANECARHKILDAVGDLALSGTSVLGAFHGHCSGHSLNLQLLQKLMSDPSAYSIVSAASL